MTRVGLTGGIASGKSTVAEALADYGAVVIDADVLAREVVAPGTPGLAAVVARFGPQVLTAAGELDRPALGQVVFADPVARADLEAIVHPAVRARAAEVEAQAPTGSVLVHVIPLLVETGQAGSFDVCVVVDTAAQTQVTRLAERNGYSPAEAASRISAQASRQDRLGVADVVLSNDGDRQELLEQVAELWSELAPSNAAG